ncbi:MAG: polyprenyl diphosphate synthase [Candidatus Roizmanbacteria bacterium]
MIIDISATNRVTMSTLNPLPNHVAIIPDGNRTWAIERNLPTLMGHKYGFEAVKKIIRHLRKRGVHTATFWGFSTENWNRSKKEIEYLMKIYDQAVDDFLQEAMDEQVKLIHLGRKDRLPESLVKKIVDAEEKTKDFTKHVLNIAIDYGGRDDIVRGVNGLLKSKDSTKECTQESFSQFLDTKNQPHPDIDILIRTSGEMRLSGFMLWQASYAELYFVEKCLPAFTPNDIDVIIDDYMNGRERRFGGNGKAMKNYHRIVA